MDRSGEDSSVDGLFQVGSPPSPSPAPRANAPVTPKEGGITQSLSFRPPPRPGSSLRKGRKSDFNSPAPPPLPTAYAHEPMPFSDATNFEGYGAHGGPSSSTPSRPSSSSSAGHAVGMGRGPGTFNFHSSSADSAHEALATTRNCRQKLQALREENQTQVNSAGLLGAGLLELRTRIEALMDELAEELSLAEANADESHDTSSKIQELSEKIEAEIEEMESQKQKLYKEVMAHGNVELAGDQSMATAAGGDSPSKAARVASAIKSLTGTTPSKLSAAAGAAEASGNAGGSRGTGMPTPRQGDRRSRNAAARQAKADSELVNEIQAGLVQEVRRLQGLLKERDDQRGALERTNAELEKQLDLFKPRVIQMTEAEDALRQENWDLEVAKQGLEEQLGERDKLLKKAELENIRLTKDLGRARETIDSQRLEIDAGMAELDKTKKQRETEVAMARKERAGMQRDVSDLQSELQKFKAQQLNNRGGLISRSVSNSYMIEGEAGEDDDGANDPETLAARLRAAYANEVGSRSPADSAYSDELGPRSPVVGRMGRDKEAHDLRAKLAMAQKKAGKDAAEKRRVREKNAELKKLLVRAGVKIPSGLDDDDVETSEDEELHWRDEAGAGGSTDSPSVKRLSSRMRSAAKLGKRPSMARRLGMSSSTSTDSIPERGESAGDDVTEGDLTLAKPDAAAGDDSVSLDDSPRQSLDGGFDPAFADVMQPGFGTPAASAQGRTKRKSGRASAAEGGATARGSPLSQTAMLADDSDEGESVSPPRSRSRQQSRRSHAAGRPQSAVFEPSALGNELENLEFDNVASHVFDEEEGEMEHFEDDEDAVEYDEAGVATDPLADLVTPALEEKEREHLAAIVQLKDEHGLALSATTNEHAKALAAAKAEHERAVEQLAKVHEEQLRDKEQNHAASLASTLADRSKIHDAALAEARSRHSRALADQVAASSAALAEAIASHKTFVEEQERRHKLDHERREESHSFALTQRDRQHVEAIKSLEASHASILAQQEAAYQRALEASEEGLRKAQAEIDTLKSTIADLNARLKAAEERNAADQAQRQADSTEHAAALKKLEAEAASAAASAAAVEADQKSQIERLRAEVGDLESRLTLTEQRASSVQSERDAASSEAIKKAHADLDSLKAALAAAETKLRATTQEHADNSRQLQEQLDASAGEHNDTKTKLQAAERRLEQLTGERAEQDSKMGETAAALAAATAAAAAAAALHHDEKRTQQEELDRHKAELAQLAKDHAQLRADADEHQRLRKQAEEALVRHERESKQRQAQMESEAVERHSRLQSEAAAKHSRLELDAAAEQARLRDEAQKEQERLRGLAEEEGKLRKKAEDAAAAAAAEAAAATAAAAASASSHASPLLDAGESSEGGHVTEVETDAERYEDAVSHMRTLSQDRPATFGVPTNAFRLPAETKDSAIQTDDLMWAAFQDDMMRATTPDMVRPLSSMTTATAASTRNETAVGQGGVMVLGGHQSTNRPRDSVSTFGGHRDGRIDSPAPSMYTVGAVMGRPSRRGSADSSWSRQTDRAGADVPPVPPLPDKTKPPVMSMPPPPSMPPPTTLPVRRAPSVVGSGVPGPPRPTSPPPSDLLSRAAQRSGHLQVPSGAAGSSVVEQPRSVSRASTRSGMQTKAQAPAAPRARQQSSTASFRTRTYSGETSASLQQQMQRTPSQVDGSIYNGLGSARKSLTSRRSTAGTSMRRGGPRQSSAASFVSDVTSELSRRFSLASSRASDDEDDEVGDETFIARPGNASAARADGSGRMRGVSEFGTGEGTDPLVIHAITQTMIGEYMYKYTRKSMGRGGHSDKRHRRYFWVHPYTKTLYWTISDPGGAKVSEGTSKSASITSVRVVEDSNPSPPGLYHESLVITTASREVKITAPSRERHEAWLGALDYLVNRPAIHDAATMATEVGAAAVGVDAATGLTDAENNPSFAQSQAQRSIGRRSRASGRPSMLTNQKSFLSRKSVDSFGPDGTSPRHRQGSVGASSVLYPSIGKRRDLAAREYLQQAERDRQMSMSPTSSLRRGQGAARSIRGGGATASSQIDPDESYDHLSDLNEPISDPRLQTAEEMLEEDEVEGFEGLDNVRACCDGKHDVSSLAHDHQHHHHHHQPGSNGGSRRASKRHGRQSSGGSRFSTVVLRSKLDAAVRAAEDREQQQRPISPSPGGAASADGSSGAPQLLPLNLAPKSSVASAMGIVSPSSPAPLLAGERPGSAGGSGPSYADRVHKIRQARQSASTTK